MGTASHGAWSLHVLVMARRCDNTHGPASHSVSRETPAQGEHMKIDGPTGTVLKGWERNSYRLACAVLS